jgi:toxin FitB
MFILDTNVLSELRRKDRADRSVVAWASEQSPTQCFISAITVLELELGVLQIERRDASQGEVLRAWLTGQILPQFHHRILPVDTAVALRCANLHVPNPRSERDALIAATGLVHGYTVITRNIQHFAPTGVATFNPWTGG